MPFIWCIFDIYMIWYLGFSLQIIETLLPNQHHFLIFLFFQIPVTTRVQSGSVQRTHVRLCWMSVWMCRNMESVCEWGLRLESTSKYRLIEVRQNYYSTYFIFDLGQLCVFALFINTNISWEKHYHWNVMSPKASKHMGNNTWTLPKLHFKFHLNEVCSRVAGFQWLCIITLCVNWDESLSDCRIPIYEKRSSIFQQQPMWWQVCGWVLGWRGTDGMYRPCWW